MNITESQRNAKPIRLWRKPQCSLGEEIVLAEMEELCKMPLESKTSLFNSDLLLKQFRHHLRAGEKSRPHSGFLN